jgi:2-keto-4-pentenoate hydratase/2-oxohepta-3-ene-1,7-dioic acid hydratase in catechol pathway
MLCSGNTAIRTKQNIHRLAVLVDSPIEKIARATNADIRFIHAPGSILPPGSKKSDWEVELGVIIGRECRYASQTRALDHVAGLCVVNDLSEREYQLERGGQWDKGKGCDTFGPIGPYLVTPRFPQLRCA